MNVELELRSVSKRYGRVSVLDNVTFACRAGTITAFCGPNGAGKSTALRVLTGITRADHGDALVNGRRLLDLPEPATVVGALLDASAFHPGRTVRETLRLGAFTIGALRSRADECADIVGLSPVAGRRSGQLSLGMRQRLGIAHALLGDPGALILDEPSNGLDPEGMSWLDRLLRDFADRGGTVLVSTHHLAAVDRTADRIVAISAGRIVADVELDDVHRGCALVSSTDPRLESVLSDAGGRPRAEGQWIRVDLDTAEVGLLARDAGIALTELRRDDRGLDRFLASVTNAEYAGRPS